MALVAILNDTHCGARNNANVFIEYQREFYEEVFFPYCIENGIKRVIHLGDYYDHRSHINFKALHANRNHFLAHLRTHKMHMDIIPGNHDLTFKDTSDLCSLKELQGYYTDCVSIHMEPTVIRIGGCDIALLPWINSSNYTESISFIENCKAPFLGAHLELSGFEMIKGIKSTHGMSAGLFKRFEQVWSGHYHIASESGNVKYLGSQMEFNWGDCDDPKFFHVFDTETRELTAVRNPVTIFKKIYYNDEVMDYSFFDFDQLDSQFVKIVVVNKNDPYAFDTFLERVQKRYTHDVKIAETFSEFVGENVSDTEINVEDTVNLLDDYVDVVETNLDKDRMKSFMRGLYTEAANQEVV